MDDNERRAVDEACLSLLGYEQNATGSNLWFNPYDTATVGKDGPSQDGRHVVPLAEALRARGWQARLHMWRDRWEVTLADDSAKPVIRAEAATLMEALAPAAARAAGMEPSQ